jgi:CDGSH-type Zn-finger protein
MAQVKITVRPNGPYRVEAPEGTIQLVDQDGREYDIQGKTAFSLCRCGASTKKPFCDGTHSKIGFQAAEAAVAREGEIITAGGSPVSGAPGRAPGDQVVPPAKPRTEM